MKEAIRFASFSLLFLLAPRLSPAQDPPQEPQEPQDESKPEGKARPTGDTVPYVEFLKMEYASAEKEGAAPTITLKFNLAPEVPKGAKIHFELEYNALSLDEGEYVLKDENRRNLTFVWKPKQRLAVGEYFLRTRMPLSEQTPAVQKALKQSDKRFPPKNEPWSCYYPSQPFKVGGPAEEALERKAICDAYSTFIDRLVSNMNEFKEKMDKVSEGKELASGNVLDVEKFKAYVIEWRKKQGDTQKEIVEFQVKEPALFQKSITAYANLRDLGQMVSKRAVQVQKEVTDKYKVEPINPPSHQYFDRSTKYKADKDALARKAERITQLACPEEGEAGNVEVGDTEAAAGEKQGGEESPPEAEKPAGDGKKQKKPEKKSPEKGAKK